MVREGATTVWECWGGNKSAAPENRYQGLAVNEDSMPMFISVEEFFYAGLAGIEGPAYHGPRIMEPGFRRIHIRPHVFGDLTSAAARIRTVRGIVAVDWKREKNGLVLKATIPPNMRAKISIPKLGLRDVSVEEGGKPVWKDGMYRDGIPGVVDGTDEQEYVTFDAGSGVYRFVLHGL
jgi:alpha-L-rhamnosidase